MVLLALCCNAELTHCRNQAVAQESGLSAILVSYACIVMVFSPVDLGEPYRRPRKWSIWTRKDRLTFPKPAPSFEHLFFRRLVLDSSVYLWASQAQLASMLDTYAKEKNMQTTADLTFEMLLGPMYLKRLRDYEHSRSGELAMTSGVGALANIMANAAHGGNVSGVCPSLLRNTVLYDLGAHRPLTLAEAFSIHGFSSPDLLDAFPDCQVIARLARHRCPFPTLFLSSSGSGPEGTSTHWRKLTGMLGNGQHLKSLTAVFVYGLAVCAAIGE